MNQIIKSAALVGEIIAPGEGVDIWVRPSPIRQERFHLRVSPGLTVVEIIQQCRAVFGIDTARLYVSMSGHAIPVENWKRVRIKSGVTLNIVAVPGKGFFRSILSVVVSIAALFLAPLLAGPLLAGLGIASGSAAAGALTGLIGAGITAGRSFSTGVFRLPTSC
ncbi:hypothetical protein [Rhizobium sp. BE258]|uniref:hypothetical protein n=1 Tax=Rhizobium sp. BE258 TaxID=2817722 RepID=UPI002863337C|nr:hypothetical protein [Rhizobium sp. BE258]MDR7146166.1 hypothetical protein [Rhizobium sp. BE258]